MRVHEGKVCAKVKLYTSLAHVGRVTYSWGLLTFGTVASEGSSPYYHIQCFSQGAVYVPVHSGVLP